MNLAVLDKLRAQSPPVTERPNRRGKHFIASKDEDLFLSF